MKTINVTFDDDEFEMLQHLKEKDESWHDAIIRWCK